MLERFSIGGRLILLTAACILTLALVFLVWWSVERLLGTPAAYREIGRIQSLVGDVKPPPLYVVEADRELKRALYEATPDTLAAVRFRFLSLHEHYSEALAAWREEDLPPNIATELFGPADAAAQHFFELAERNVLPQLAQGQRRAALESYRAARASFNAHRDAVNRVIGLSSLKLQQLEERTQTNARHIRWLVLMAGLAGAVAILLVGLAVYRSIMRPIRRMIRTVTALSTGSTDMKVGDTLRVDELGPLARALDAWRRSIIKDEESARKIEFMAHHDPLTHLPNRVLVQDRFRLASLRATRYGTKLALVFIDLDHFKLVNDAFGRDAGDALLKVVSQRIIDCVRAGDTVSRTGGDEFTLILSDLAGPESVLRVLTDLLQRLSEPYTVAGQATSLTASIGVALYPADGQSFGDLLKKADIALYRAKEAGRGTYKFFDRQMNQEMMDQVSLTADLKQALEKREFLLHYQPQIEIATGRLVGVEALLRWQHPKRGLVPPMDFIPLAEKTRLIVPIGDWVAEEACRQATDWRRQGLPHLTVAINVSAAQFQHGDVEAMVQHALDAGGHDPALLELELTESLLISNVDAVLRAIRRLKQTGVRTAIDDFGTGYSSLAYLKQLSLDKIKIDRSFVLDLLVNANSRAIVTAIIQMAHGLGLKVIAEGVENAETLEALRLLGCDEAQGYGIARPMPAAQIPAFMAEAS